MPLVERLRRLFDTRSAWALLVANLVPLLGALLLDWSIGDLLLLYWAESAVIGLYNLAKMATTLKPRVLFLAPFFCFHYGMFMLAHLVFITLIFVARQPFAEGTLNDEQVVERLREAALRVWPGVAALVASHGYSFVHHFVRNREWRGVLPERFLVAPYGRIMLMQITLIVGGGMALVLRAPVAALVVMVLLKVLVDLWAHQRAHRPPHAPVDASPSPD